jgi:triphosphoribosyl-dephospho-CoA synthase
MAGIEFKEEDYKLLMEKIRPLGIEAEKSMFNATKGVNTHKGLIFSLGIISAAAGNLYYINKEIYQSSIDICNLVKLMTKEITKELDNIEDKENLTYGEKLYLKYGVKGIRGEVESGFRTVLEYSLPILKDLINKEIHINHILIQVLLHLMAYSEDSNILGRHDMQTLEFVKEKALTALSHGGYLTSYGKVFVNEMDKYFIEKNISPGGSADLLAVTMMLYMLEHGDKLD